MIFIPTLTLHCCVSGSTLHCMIYNFAFLSDCLVWSKWKPVFESVTSKSSQGALQFSWFDLVWSGLVWFGLVQVSFGPRWNQFEGVSSKSRLGVPGAVWQWRARPPASRLYLIIDLDTGPREILHSGTVSSYKLLS